MEKAGNESGVFDPKFVDHVVLLKTEAFARSAVVSNVAYKVHLNLPRCENFSGHARISFSQIAPLPADGLFLDFHGLAIFSLVVNEVTMDLAPEVFSGQRIHLKSDSFGGKDGVGATHSVEVSFLNKYRVDGTALHRFVDPEDKEDYLYTQFESFFAHGVFPCFD